LRVLITGATGTAGTHLSLLALECGAKVYGLARSNRFSPGVVACCGDVSNARFVESVLRDVQPMWIFHLAALIPSAAAEASPEDYFQTNIAGTYHVLEAVRRCCPTTRVLIASSSSVYGRSDWPDQPITEDMPLRPQSLYALTKTTQDLMGAQFYAEHGTDVVRVRTFNQIGPMEPRDQIGALVARQIALIEAGRQEPVIRVKTLMPSRDFSDVRDVARGYWSALTSGQAGQVYNLCSGRATTVAELIQLTLSLTALKNVEIVEGGPLPGPQDTLAQVGDASRLKACSGWEPSFSLAASLSDLLAEYRAEIRATQKRQSA